jgi:NADPH-dependent ferric siderophore reductase|tara:strand:- start:69 stop:1076 length:1008 start_codon:yes stop_codon:yes gene_type:complete
VLNDDFSEIARYLNQFHRDSLLLVASALLGHATPTDTSIDKVSRTSCLIQVVAGDDQFSHEVALDITRDAGEASVSDAVRRAIFDLVRNARRLDRSGRPPTQLERIVAATESETWFDAEVRSARQLSSSIRELTFGSLAGFASLGGDEHIRIGLATDDQSRAGRAFFTVRRARPAAGEIDVWFARHPSGAVSQWAASAQPGTTARVSSPRRVFQPPPDITHLVLIGDAPGLAALARLAEEWSPEIKVTAIVAVDCTTARVAFAATPEVDVILTECGALGTVAVRWFYRAPRPPAGTYVFGAGEHHEMALLKRHLRGVGGIGRDQLAISEYWRRQS